jgi:cytochrome oxidase assembly protein ShyY1
VTEAIPDGPVDNSEALNALPAKHGRFWYLRGRYLAGHLTVIVLVVTMINLGFWQLRRLDGRKAQNRAIVEAQHAPPKALTSIIGGRKISEVRLPEWQQIEVDGVYDHDREVLVRARSYNGRPGYHVLTPLRLADGTALIVNRGWVPFTIPAGRPTAVGLPPGGAVHVIGRVRPTQHPGTLETADPSQGVLTELNRADIVRLAKQLPYAINDSYIELTAQTPPQPGGIDAVPALIALPALDEGPHFSYAVQWFLFSTLAVLIWGLFVRRAVEEHRPGYVAPNYDLD